LGTPDGLSLPDRQTEAPTDIVGETDDALKCMTHVLKQSSVPAQRLLFSFLDAQRVVAGSPPPGPGGSNAIRPWMPRLHRARKKLRVLLMRC
jgi:hypothetical protein